jgi:hypothetical protein
MICSAKAKEVKCLQQSNTAEEHETTKQTIHNKQRMTLKGSNLHTKNAFTRNHNPEGVEFQRNNRQNTKLIRA